MFLFQARTVLSPTNRASCDHLLASRYRFVAFVPPSKRPITLAIALASGAFSNASKVTDVLLMLSDLCEQQFRDLPWCNFGLLSMLNVLRVATTYMKSRVKKKPKKLKKNLSVRPTKSRPPPSSSALTASTLGQKVHFCLM